MNKERSSIREVEKSGKPADVLLGDVPRQVQEAERKTAIVYVRVSDPGQAEEELSIPSQLERCRTKAEELGADVVRVFADEGKSGRFDKRAAFQDAIAYCENFPTDYLVTWSTSRFARNKLDAGIYKLKLEIAGTRIVYVSQAIDREDDTGWVTESMFEIFDELQSRMISKDTRRSMETNARNGHWNGGGVPFGFRVVPDPRNEKRRRLVPDDAEAPILQRIFDMRLNGMGAQAIALQLNAEGLRNRKYRWTRKSILRLLHNETAIGHIVFGRRRGRLKRVEPRERWIVVKSHKAIVDPVKFATVQQLLADADMTTGRGASMRSKFVFTGLLRCGRCGGALSTESAKGRSRRYWYYNCRTAQTQRACDNRRLRARELDDWLIDEIVERVLAATNLKDLAEELDQQARSWEEDRARRRRGILRQIDEAERRQENLFEVLEVEGKGTRDLPEIMARLRRYKTRLVELRRELAELDAQEPPKLDLTEEDLQELGEILREAIKTTDDPKKLRSFFSSFIQQIVVGNDQIRIEYRPERLVACHQAGVVPSKGLWLPGRDSNPRPSG